MYLILVLLTYLLPAAVFFLSFSFFFFATPCGLWDHSSPTRDRTWAPAVKALSPNHWTAREFPLAAVSEHWNNLLKT